MCPANGGGCYDVMLSFIGWVHTQNDPWCRLGESRGKQLVASNTLHSRVDSLYSSQFSPKYSLCRHPIPKPRRSIGGLCWVQDPISIWRHYHTSIEILIIKINWSHECLILIMGSPITECVKQHSTDGDIIHRLVGGFNADFGPLHVQQGGFCINQSLEPLVCFYL